MLSWELSDFGSEVSDLGSEGGFFEHSLSHSSSTYGQRMEVQCFAIFAEENTLPANCQLMIIQHFFYTSMGLISGSDDSAGNFSLLESFGLSTLEVADLCFSVLRSVIDPWVSGFTFSDLLVSYLVCLEPKHGRIDKLHCIFNTYSGFARNTSAGSAKRIRD
ncbi:hypothetical protein Tco_0666998 [Tanacetum coccineum]